MITRFAALAITALTLTNCDGGDRRAHLLRTQHDEILRRSVPKIKVGREFSSGFPTASYNIAYIAGEHGRPRLNGKVLIRGRYILTLSVPVKLTTSDGKNIAEQAGKVEIVLEEISSIDPIDGGGMSIHYGASNKISQKKWDELVGSKWSFEKCGLMLKNTPVPGLNGIDSFAPGVRLN